MPIRLVIGATTAVLILATSSTAWADAAADEGAPTYSLEISDEEPTEEATFPDPVVVELVGITRGDETDYSGVAVKRGSISLFLEGYKRDYAGLDEPYDPNEHYDQNSLQNAEYGLRFELEGEHPDTLNVGSTPRVLLHYPHSYNIGWNDEETSDEPIDSTLTVTWIDRYGREGPTSDPLQVIDDPSQSDQPQSSENEGDADSSCSTIANNSSTPAMLVLPFLLLLGLRSRD